jgi:hypothetical protein
MALFVVTHRHSQERCPAADPNKGLYLLKRLSKECTSTYGVTIYAEAVADGQHSLHLILDAADREQVERFMAPFAQGGSVSVLPASPCEDVVTRARC